MQADANNVFDVLFSGPDAVRARSDNIKPDGCSRKEVGCWCHCRRRHWEAAVAKSVVGREALARIGRMFELDTSWRTEPPDEIKRTLKSTRAALSGWCHSGPRDRLVELAPLFWARTRARLDPKALAMELGPIEIPAEPLDTSAAAEQQAAG